jgi:hypothetical protein
MNSAPKLEEGLHRLRQLLEAMPVVSEIEVIDELGRGEPDAFLRIATPQGTQLIQVEMKVSGEARYIREASFLLTDRMKLQPGSYGVVIAPYISPESRVILRQQGQGWLDLAGNCFLSLPAVHVDLEKANTNPFTTKRKQKSIFSPKSGRILKVLLTERGPLKGNEIAARAHVSQAQVSKVREALIDREWATADSNGIRVVKPLALLDAWREEREPPVLASQGYTLYHGRALDTHLQTLFMKVATAPFSTLLLAGHSVARRIAPFARVAGDYFYADAHGIELINEFLRLSPTESGANIFIYEPEDEMMQLDSIALTPEPIRGTGLLQTYLDLSAMGDRDREAADYLLKEKLGRMLTAPADVARHE